jgi:hypothetical protein
MRNFSEEEFGRIFCGAWRRKKPGFALQFLANRFAVCCGISASIPCAAKGLTAAIQPLARRKVGAARGG